MVSLHGRLAEHELMQTRNHSLGTLASIATRPTSLMQTFEKLLSSSGSEEEEVSDIATLGMVTASYDSAARLTMNRHSPISSQDNAA